MFQSNLIYPLDYILNTPKPKFSKNQINLYCKMKNVVMKIIVGGRERKAVPKLKELLTTIKEY